jgi:hypothetical protein
MPMMLWTVSWPTVKEVHLPRTALIAFAMGATPLADQDPALPAVQRVRSSDIGNPVVILGRLGVQLGEVLTVEGEWSRRDASGRELSAQEDRLIFLVSTINGSRLDTPVEFRPQRVTPADTGDAQDLRPAAGDIWELRGVELGGYRGVPWAVLKQEFPPEQMVPATADPFGFYTEFKYYSRRIVLQAAPNPNADSHANLDWTILELVLRDLITLPHSPFAHRGEPNRPIVFSPERIALPVSAEDLLDRRYAEAQWNKLSAAQIELARQAARQLVRRQDDRDEFERFRPQDRRIVSEKKRDEAEREPGFPDLGPQTFRAFTPGYSRDRQFAMIRLHFPWGSHTGRATYVLARKDGEWVILIRSFVYFL